VVQVHRVVIPPDVEPSDVVEGSRRMGFPEVVQHGAGRVDASGEALSAQGVERLNAKPFS